MISRNHLKPVLTISIMLLWIGMMNAEVIFTESFESPDITADYPGKNPFQGTISGFNVDTVVPGWVGVNRYTFIFDKGINDVPGNEDMFINSFGDQVVAVFNYLPSEPQNSSLTTTPDSLDEVLMADRTYTLTFNVASTKSYPLNYHVQLLAIDDSIPDMPLETVLVEVDKPIASNDLSANSDSLVFTPTIDNEHLGERIAIRLRKGEGDWHYHALYDNITLSVDSPCPFGLRASAGKDGVLLEWNNGDETAVNIFRDGEEIASGAAVDPPSYTDTGAQPGEIEYKLIFTVPGNESCGPLTLTYDAGITQLTAKESEDGEIVLKWKNNLPYEGIKISRDGKVIETSFDGSAEEYIDANPPFAGIITYSVVPTNGNSEPKSVETRLCGCYVPECINIDNPGFEDPDVNNESHLSLLDTNGWGFYIGDKGATVDIGVWDLNIAFFGMPPGGENVGYANATGVGEHGAGFAQILKDTLTAGTTYTLSAVVGNHKGYDWAGYSVQLLAGADAQYIDDGDGYANEVTGGELLAEDNSSLEIAPDTFETVIVKYTFDPAHTHLLGTPLQIRLLTLGEQTDFDCVKLKAETSAADVSVSTGDTNCDGNVNLADTITILSYLFASGDACCLTNFDANGDKNINLADAITLLSYQFSGGPLTAPDGSVIMDPGCSMYAESVIPQELSDCTLSCPY